MDGKIEIPEGTTFTPQNNEQAYLAYGVGLITDPDLLPPPRTIVEALLRELCIAFVAGCGPKITDATYLFVDNIRLDAKEELIGCLTNVTSAASMFSGSDKLTEVDLSAFDTSRVTEMGFMFHGCSALTSLDLSSFDTSNVTNMSGMFDSCVGLTNLDVTKFDTSKVANMASMFSFCRALTSLDVSHFDTSNVESMYKMFGNCGALTSVGDLSGWDTSKVDSMSGMFTLCDALTQIIGFSATKSAGMTIGFPYGDSTSSRANLKRLTFRTDLPEGKYAIRSAIKIPYCDMERSGFNEMISTITDVSGLNLSANYTKITITGNPCITGTNKAGETVETLTAEDREACVARGWTLVE